MDGVLLQGILAGSMLVTTTVTGLIPLKVVSYLNKKQNKGRGQLIISLLSCFSGGVFMATCFLDIFPHINHIYDEFKKDSGLTMQFPLPQLFICIGFFVVYLIEEICHHIFSKSGHSHSHSPKVEEYDSKNKIEQVIEGSIEYALSDEADQTWLKSITFAIAISFHSLLEGFALGVQDTPTGILTLFLSLLIHKAIEAFSFGLNVCKGTKEKLKVVIMIVIYSIMTPVGSIAGYAIQNANINPLWKDGTILVLEAMAAGTFIYVTFLEVLAPEKENEHSNLLQLFSIILGFALITVLQVAFMGMEAGHSHSAAVGSTLAPMVTGMPTTTAFSL